jgi:hypothetical protein
VFLVKIGFLFFIFYFLRDLECLIPFIASVYSLPRPRMRFGSVRKPIPTKTSSLPTDLMSVGRFFAVNRPPVVGGELASAQ